MWCVGETEKEREKGGGGVRAGQRQKIFEYVSISCFYIHTI